MMKLSEKIMSALLLTVLAAATCYAQGQGQAQGGGQFAQFREQHKYTFQLTGMVRDIGEIDRDPKYTLKPAQAKQVLNVLQPLRSKPKLTQDQAKDALKNLKKALTVDQLNAIAKVKPRPQGTQAGQPGQRRTGEGRTGGDRPTSQRASRPPMDPNAMKNFNPFYNKVDPKDQSAVQRAKRWDGFFVALRKKADTADKAQPKTVKKAAPPAKKAPAPKTATKKK